MQTETAATAGPPRSGRGARDMVISMVVLLIPVAIIVALFRFLGNEDVQVVDPGPAVEEARVAAAFPVAEPVGLGSGWRPLSATFRRGAAGATLRIGYLTPDGGAVQLIESSEPAETLVERELGGTVRPQGAVTVGGRSWQSALARTDELVLMLVEPGRTVIVVGRASQDELTALAASLR